MLYEKLPNIGDICSTGFSLRVNCADAISAVEIAAGQSASGKTSATALRDYFIACANAADKAAGGSGAGVVANGTVLASNQAVITDGVEVVAPVTGSGTAGVTPTIAAGVVTGLALASA